MLDNQLSRQYICEYLEPLLDIFEKEVVPGQVELLANNGYSLNYAWMYSFEKRLKYTIEGVLRTKFTYRQERLLFGAGGVFSEGLSNAFAHGHKKKMEIPISVWVAVSKKGLGIAIKDRGKGFDVEEVFGHYRKGKPFFHIAGNGLKALSLSKQIMACYRDNGTQLCLLYSFSQ